MVASTSACGTSSDSKAESSIQRVIPGDRIYTTEDIEGIKPAGVKIVKNYDVDELPGAVDAKKLIYNKLDYEVRFYASHERKVISFGFVSKKFRKHTDGPILPLSRQARKQKNEKAVRWMALYSLACPP